MATIKATLKNKITGDIVYVKTLGELIENTDGTNTWNLGGVEENAQENVIENVTINGNSGTLTNKTLAFTIDQDAYTIEEAATPTTGYLKTYQLMKAGVAVSGSVVNIPKDFLVKSASMGICETAGVPSCTPALNVGDPYLDFVINVKEGSATDEHIYINVAALVDVYTEGNGINIANNVISVDTTDTNIVDAAPTASSVKFVQSGGVYTALAGKVDANTAITGATKCKITYDSKGLVTAGADLEASDIPNLASSKINAMTGYTKGSSFTAIEATDTLNVAIGKLEKGLDTKQDTLQYDTTPTQNSTNVMTSGSIYNTLSDMLCYEAIPSS